MLYIIFLIFVNARCTFTNDLNNECNNKWQGLLTLMPNEMHPTNGCNITAILDSSYLNMYKGDKKIKGIKLIEIKAPVHVVPNSKECLIIHYENESSMLCSPNEYSRDAWWIALTQQLICQRLGNMRNEIAGEASLEEQQELEYEHVLDNKNQKGVNIHIDDNVKNLPKIAIHYSYHNNNDDDDDEKEKIVKNEKVEEDNVNNEREEEEDEREEEEDEREEEEDESEETDDSDDAGHDEE